MFQRGLNSAEGGVSGEAPSAASAETDPEQEDAPVGRREKGKEGKQGKPRRRTLTGENDDKSLAKVLKTNAHSINEEFIPTALATLGPDMHEGGPIKAARDKVFFTAVAALGLGGVRERGKIENEAALVPGRSKLVATGLQTVDQVARPFPPELPSRSNVLTIGPFCSMRGR